MVSLTVHHVNSFQHSSKLSRWVCSCPFVQQDLYNTNMCSLTSVPSASGKQLLQCQVFPLSSVFDTRLRSQMEWCIIMLISCGELGLAAGTGESSHTGTLLIHFCLWICIVILINRQVFSKMLSLGICIQQLPHPGHSFFESYHTTQKLVLWIH